MTEGLKGVRVLVTGATGFLGRHVCSLLSTKGAEVLQASRSICDLTEEAKALAAIFVAGPDIVIHLAGPREDASPSASVRDPLLMGLNVLSACAIAQAKTVMVCRSGRPGTAPHAVSQALLAAARGYRKERGLHFVQLVPCDIYGPLDVLDDRRLVPYMLSRVLAAKASGAKAITLDGNGKRPFPLLYAEDAAKAVALACELPGCDEPLQICGAGELHLEEISGIAARVAGFQGSVDWDPKADRWTPAVQDGAIAREILGWEPLTKCDDGLKATVEWLSARLAPKVTAAAVPEAK